MAMDESVESFAARFCELNKVSVKQFFAYISATIDKPWRPESVLSDGDRLRISEALHEPFAIVTSVVAPYEGKADALGSFCNDPPHRDQIQYCETCATAGYHSHFHTFSWLDRCPFDGAELLTHSCHAGIDGFTNRIGAVTEILRTHWPAWPGGVPDSASKKRHLAPSFRSFQRWILDTNIVARNLADMHLPPRRSIYWIEAQCCARRVNQIRSLLPPPNETVAYFSTAGAASPNMVRLDAQSASTARDLIGRYGFHELIWFYRICRNSDPAGSACRDALDSDLAALRIHHTTCHCGWGHSMNEGWRRVHPDEWPHWDLKCPYEVACSFLEANYGDFRCGQSHRAADKEFFRYIECAEKFGGAGLARHHGAPEYGLSEVIQRCVGGWQPWVEWTGPLANIFDAVIEAGRASDTSWIHRWLTDVGSGAAPQTSPFPYPPVGLIEREGGMAILSWEKP